MPKAYLPNMRTYFAILLDGTTEDWKCFSSFDSQSGEPIVSDHTEAKPLAIFTDMQFARQVANNCPDPATVFLFETNCRRSDLMEDERYRIVTNKGTFPVETEEEIERRLWPNDLTEEEQSLVESIKEEYSEEESFPIGPKSYRYYVWVEVTPDQWSESNFDTFTEALASYKDATGEERIGDWKNQESFLTVILAKETTIHEQLQYISKTGKTLADIPPCKDH